MSVETLQQLEAKLKNLFLRRKTSSLIAEREALKSSLSQRELDTIDNVFGPYLHPKRGSVREAKLIELFGAEIYYGNKTFGRATGIEDEITMEAWCLRAVTFAQEIAIRIRHEMKRRNIDELLEHPNGATFDKENLTAIEGLLHAMDSIRVGWDYSPWDARGIQPGQANRGSIEKDLRRSQAENWERSLVKHKLIARDLGFTMMTAWNYAHAGQSNRQFNELEFSAMMMLHDLGRAVTHDRFAHESIQHLIFRAVGIPNEFIDRYEIPHKESHFASKDFDAYTVFRDLSQNNPQQIIFHICDVFAKTNPADTGTTMEEFSTDVLLGQVERYMKKDIHLEERAMWREIFSQYPNLNTTHRVFMDKFCKGRDAIANRVQYHLNEAWFIRLSLEWLQREGIDLSFVREQTQKSLDIILAKKNGLPASIHRV